jgi:hypothetical protein
MPGSQANKGIHFLEGELSLMHCGKVVKARNANWILDGNPVWIRQNSEIYYWNRDAAPVRKDSILMKTGPVMGFLPR